MSQYPADSDQPENQPPPQGQAPRLFVRGPKTNQPIVTYVLIGFTVLFYLAQVVLERLTGGDVLFLYLGKINPFIMGGQFWRLFTPALLHASPMHLLANMYALFMLGRSYETINGHLRFFLLCLVSAFGGNVLSFVLGEYPSLGASTLTFGLLAAQAMFIFQNRDFFPNRGRGNLMNILMILLINLAIGVSAGSRIDNWGHLGGLIAGVFFAYLAGARWNVQRVDNHPSMVDQRTSRETWMAFLLVFIAFAAIAAIPFLSR